MIKLPRGQPEGSFLRFVHKHHDARHHRRRSSGSAGLIVGSQWASESARGHAVSIVFFRGIIFRTVNTVLSFRSMVAASISTATYRQVISSVVDVDVEEITSQGRVRWKKEAEEQDGRGLKADNEDYIILL